MAADYWLAAIPLDVDPSWRPPPWTPACGWRPDPWTSIPFTWNIVNVTVELSSFGRPKEEKLKPHLHPLREATTTTWSKYFLGHRSTSTQSQHLERAVGNYGSAHQPKHPSPLQVSNRQKKV
ncbi:hypothetical protein Taro_035628 [Colocasia esculenta]|uniref:Uncharacterized protein n=1 Tax=Colocasia esculenta TaxID=4460 RepID=A0A843WJ70_COLES|nr:hypothetical protein [Colocasia esculenta]